MVSLVAKPSNLQRYSLSVIATLIGIALQVLLNHSLGNLRFLIVWPVGFSVMALVGFGPACVSILLSALTAELFFAPPAAASPSDHVKTLIFVVSSLIVAYLLHRRHERAEALERLLIENELQRSEDEMAAVFDKAPVGMAQATFQTQKFLRVNAQFSEITGYSQDELLSMPASAITHPDDLEEGRDQFARLVKGEIDLYDYEKRYVRKNGEVVWVRARASIIRDGLGRPQSILGVVQDINDRKAAEERYQQLTETLPQLVWTALPDGSFDYLSRQWLEYTGAPRDQQRGYGWLAIVHPDDRELARASWVSAISGHKPLDFEWRLRRHDGSYRWFKTRGQPAFDKAGRIVSWIGTSTDVNDQRQAVELAEQANRLKSTFLANMSHEIRTPMTAVLGFAELLRDDDLPPGDREDAVERIVRGGHTLLKLIDDILDISKIEADQIHIERVSFSPRELVGEVVAQMRPQAALKNVDIVLEWEPNVPDRVTSDSTRVRQILTNLLGNAVKFTLSGTIHLRVSSKPGRGLTFEVRDTGVGIQPEERLRLFQPFAQGDASATRRFGGSGLGLALSKRLCRELGGDLVLRTSVPGEGSCFVASIDEDGPA